MDMAVDEARHYGTAPGIDHGDVTIRQRDSRLAPHRLNLLVMQQDSAIRDWLAAPTVDQRTVMQECIAHGFLLRNVANLVSIMPQPGGLHRGFRQDKGQIGAIS